MTATAIAKPVLATLELAGGTMYLGIKAAYGAGKDLNAFVNRHIAELQGSKDPGIARTGRVLEGAKEGFGLGFVAPVAIIATGQLLLGNPLVATSTVITAPFNPVAMTCAAVGAIYFGWRALDRDEQESLLAKVSEGLQLGVELIRAIIRFVTELSEDVFSKKQLLRIGQRVKSARKAIVNMFDASVEVTSDGFRDALEDSGRYWDGVSEALVRFARRDTKRPLPKLLK